MDDENVPVTRAMLSGSTRHGVEVRAEIFPEIADARPMINTQLPLRRRQSLSYHLPNPLHSTLVVAQTAVQVVDDGMKA